MGQEKQTWVDGKAVNRGCGSNDADHNDRYLFCGVTPADEGIVIMKDGNKIIAYTCACYVVDMACYRHNNVDDDLNFKNAAWITQDHELLYIQIAKNGRKPVTKDGVSQYKEEDVLYTIMADELSKCAKTEDKDPVKALKELVERRNEECSNEQNVSNITLQPLIIQKLHADIPDGVQYGERVLDDAKNGGDGNGQAVSIIKHGSGNRQSQKKANTQYTRMNKVVPMETEGKHNDDAKNEGDGNGQNQNKGNGQNLNTDKNVVNQGSQLSSLDIVSKNPDTNLSCQETTPNNATRTQNFCARLANNVRKALRTWGCMQ